MNSQYSNDESEKCCHENMVLLLGTLCSRSRGKSYIYGLRVRWGPVFSKDRINLKPTFCSDVMSLSNGGCVSFIAAFLAPRAVSGTEQGSNTFPPCIETVCIKNTLSQKHLNDLFYVLWRCSLLFPSFILFFMESCFCVWLSTTYSQDPSLKTQSCWWSALSAHPSLQMSHMTVLPCGLCKAPCWQCKSRVLVRYHPCSWRVNVVGDRDTPATNYTARWKEKVLCLKYKQNAAVAEWKE